MLLILNVQELTNNENFNLTLLRVELPLVLDKNLIYHQLINSRLSAKISSFSLLLSL